ncbi:MAG TPA: hypothetical protein DCZ91_10140 [Lachnospiraceae bacterium]|nr:hypothetical protein [Lachnospiraceae bacterium]
MKMELKAKKKSERKTNMKRLVTRWLSMAMVMAAAVFLLTGCGSTKLSADFDEEKVKTAAQEAIGYMVAGEYEECVGLMSEEMQVAVSAEILASNMETVAGQKGAFQEYKSSSVLGQKNQEGTDYAVAVIVAAFENGNVTFTISYDKDMQMIGFWMK